MLTLPRSPLAVRVQGPNPQPLSIPFPQAIQSLEPARLKPPARVTAIAAGGDHSMAVTVAGALLAFGSNKHGQVGCCRSSRAWGTTHG
jgi:alpha-tubulin suppressor-like RCC1 family protein